MSIYYPEPYDLAPDGVTTVFTLPTVPAAATSVLVLWNGQVQRTSYTLVGAILTTTQFTAAAGDSLVVYYTTQSPTPVPPIPAGQTGFLPEAIANALFVLLAQANYPFASMDRRGRVPENVPTANQPYMALIDAGPEVVQNQVQGLEKWTIYFNVLVYLRIDATTASIRGTPLNAALQAIVEVMRPVPITGKQTLGGLCVHAWIEGQVLMGGGILDEQCVMAIPIKVLTGR